MKRNKKAVWEQVAPHKFPGSARPLTKAEQTRMKILDATLESLSENGIEKTTLQTIAKHAGLGVSHIAYHFPDKQDLIREAIHLDTLQYRDTLDSFLSSARTPEERFRGFLQANFEWHKSKRHRLTWLLEFYLAAQDKKLAQAYVDSRADGRRRIQEYIGPDMIRRGFSYEDLEKEAFALQMMATGYLMEFIARFPLEPDLEFVNQAFESILRRAFPNS